MNVQQQRRRRLHIATGIPVLVIMAVFLIFLREGPYGVEHFKRIRAATVASSIIAWEKSGADEGKLAALAQTNATMIWSLVYSNVVHENRVFDVLIRVDSQEFRNRGSLFAARGGSVIWIGSDGQTEQVR